MTSRRLLSLLQFSVIAVLAASVCPSLLAQGPIPDAPVPAAVAPLTSAFIEPVRAGGEKHRFWDTENFTLFAASASLNSADFAVTRANLQSGGQELNPIVRVFGRSTAGLAVNFAGETAGVVGISYFFHKTGHHRLERMVSVVNIGSSIGAVGYGLTHRNTVSPANNVGTQMARQAGPLSINLRISSR
jgi:hypothetical protein